MNDSINEGIKIIHEWKINREVLIFKIKFILCKLNKVQKNVDISRLVGSSIALVGATITGISLILVPFTFGTSLSLTVAGASLSMAGSLTSAGSHLANFCISNSELKVVQNLLNEDIRLFRKMQTILADETFTTELIGFLELNGSNITKIINAFQITTALATTCEDILSLSTSLARNLVTSLPKILSKLTIAFNIFGTLFNIIEIAHTAKSVSFGSKSEYVKNLENITIKMQDDLKHFDFIMF